MLTVTRRRSASWAAALFLSLTGAVVGVAAPAHAASVTGSWVLHYEWYSAPGYWQTANVTLNGNGTCSLASGCTWRLSNGSFSMSVPNPRRNGVTYQGSVTGAGLNTSAQPGYMYFGTTGDTHQGVWYANR